MITLGTIENEYPHGTMRSTNGSKTKVILEEKGLTYQVKRIPGGHIYKKPPELLEKHPLGKVPWIEDDGFVVHDSTVINEYFEEAYPSPSLVPQDPKERARMRMLENYGDEAILVGCLPLIWFGWWAPEDKRDEASMEAGRETLRSKVLPYIEQALEGRDYLCGDFSLADAPYMALAMVLEVDGTALPELPLVTAYLDRLRARSSFQAISARTSLEKSAGR